MTSERQALNELVGRLVFGHGPNDPEATPQWAGRIDLAWRVVRELEERGWIWEITNMHEGARRWHARVSYLPSSNQSRHVPGPWARGDNPAEAICRAACQVLADQT